MPTACRWATPSGARSTAVSGSMTIEKGDYVGMLAERWEVDKTDKNVWTFHLKRGAQAPATTARSSPPRTWCIPSTRINTDPQSKQKQNTSPIKEIVALDNYTVKIVTKEPTASLLEFIFDRVIITAKDLYEKHGARDADRRYPWGWGPYKLKELVIGQRIVLEKEQRPSGRQAGKPGHADLQHHARAGAARDGAAQQRDPDRPVHSAASRRARQVRRRTRSCIRRARSRSCSWR